MWSAASSSRLSGTKRDATEADVIQGQSCCIHVLAIDCQATSDRFHDTRISDCYLATHPDPNVRDGARAVQLLGGAETSPEGQIPEIFDTLAAAYAAQGQYARAVSLAQKAIDLATAQGSDALALEYRTRLQLYQNNQPFVMGELELEE